ncbi:hypothetical protein P9112_010788 [Eukaryota sp. TZLM1-RC]
MDALIDDEVTFTDFLLDGRVIDILAKQQLKHPTIIQSKAIPLILKGKDVVVRAPTGTGKTLAYLLPLLQTCILSPQNDPIAAILLPTSELVMQLSSVLSPFCSALNLFHSTLTKDTPSPDVSASHIIIATPAKLVKLLRESVISFGNLKFLVFDECDLMLSFGFKIDLDSLRPFVPATCQSALLSATFDDDVVAVKKLFLHSPVTIKLEDSLTNIDESIVTLSDEDRYLCLFCLIKLLFFKGRVLVFVKDIEAAYKIKMLLERFDVASISVVHSELPINSRIQAISRFNSGNQSILIATDDVDDYGDYGMSRGVDFDCVRHVVNFDFPSDYDVYTHRKGRTGRAGKSGSVLTFITSSSQSELIDSWFPADSKPKVFDFPNEFESFRYRVSDVLSSITKRAITTYRAKELKRALLESEKLQSRLNDNPLEKKILKKNLNTKPKNQEINHLPEYLQVTPAPLAMAQKDENRKQLSDKVKNNLAVAYHQNRKRFKTLDPLLSFSVSKNSNKPEIGIVEDRSKKITARERYRKQRIDKRKSLRNKRPRL